MRTKFVANCAIALLCSACAGDGVGTSGHTVRDSAGVRIVESVTPVWSESDAWRVGEHPIVDIGGVEGDPNYELYRVMGGLRLPDGRIVIVNAGTSELRFYDSEGRYISVSGGRGEGPGEFQGLYWLNPFRGDSLIAYDLRLRRLSVFDDEGQFLRSVSTMGASDVLTRVAGVFRDGSSLCFGSGRPSRDATNGLFREDVHLFLQSENGELVDSLGSFPGDETYIHALDGGMMVLRPEFGRSSQFFTTVDHFYVATNDSYEIGVYARDGSLTSLIRRQFANLEVTEEHMEVIAERRQQSDLPPEMQTRFNEAYAAIPTPETMPAYSSALLDDLGNLWVEEYRQPGDEMRHWTVFDTEGVMLGTLPMPAGFRLFQAGGDFVLGRWNDELDVEHVQVFELIKADG